MSPCVAFGSVAGYALDLVLGDPQRWHPVAGFGNLAIHVERRTWADDRRRGAAVTGGLVASVVLGVLTAQRALGRRPATRMVLDAVVVWTALGQTSLLREGAEMRRLLDAGDLSGARQRLSHLCGRDPSSLDEVGLARATVESIAENTSDAVVAPLVWGAIAGAPAVAGYRALNTLDAMIGSRTSRYRQFGWAAARCDDVANWMPARVTALLATLLAPLVSGRAADARATWRRDAPGHPSPNAGPVEAAFAGALGVRLGGTVNTYGDHRDTRPPLGDGRDVAVSDITRAATLSRAVGLAALVLCAVAAAARGRR